VTTSKSANERYASRGDAAIVVAVVAVVDVDTTGVQPSFPPSLSAVRCKPSSARMLMRGKSR
jgi:hypothetical protein